MSESFSNRANLFAIYFRIAHNKKLQIFWNSTDRLVLRNYIFFYDLYHKHFGSSWSYLSTIHSKRWFILTCTVCLRGTVYWTPVRATLFIGIIYKTNWWKGIKMLHYCSDISGLIVGLIIILRERTTIDTKGVNYNYWWLVV